MPPDYSNDVSCAIRELAFALRDHTSELKMEFNWRVTHHDFATKQDLENLANKIMSKISDYLAQQSTFNDDLEVKIDAVATAQTGLATSVNGVSGDVAELKRLIDTMQNSAGEFTPADQATADAIQARTTALAAKFAAASDAIKVSSDALKALDDLTPPPAPPPV